ncbi:MAG: extracellular solute-binding protein [Dongiaceae bacterium]
MARHTVSRAGSAATQAAARNFTRRSLLRWSGAAVGAAVAAPFVVPRSALSSSGELTWFTWPDYSTPELVSNFEAATGIKLTVVNFGTNDEAINKLRTTDGEGFDLLNPSITMVPNYTDFELLLPLDESKIPNLANMLPAFYEKSADLGGVWQGKRVAFPYDWGTEALAWNTDEATLEYGSASFGDLWKEEYAGKVGCRPRSALNGVALYLEGEGKLPEGSLRKAYGDPDTAHQVHTMAADFIIERKSAINMYWSSANDYPIMFLQNGVAIAQTWDGPIFTLKNEGEPLMYMAPKEGALTWIDSMCIPKKAQNIEQAYAFMDWALTPEVGGMMSLTTNYNSVVRGAEEFTDDNFKRNFQEAYPGDALDRLWFYPAEGSEYTGIEQEYADKIMAS